MLAIERTATGGDVNGRYSLNYVKDRYGVPVKRGQVVVTEGGRRGVVTCGDGAHIRVRLDGDEHSGRYHPLALDYGDGITPKARLDHHNARIEAWNDWLNRRITAEEYHDRMTLARSSLDGVHYGPTTTPGPFIHQTPPHPTTKG